MLEARRLETPAPAPAIFDPFAAPWVKPEWHGRIMIVPAPEVCGVYGREWPIGGPCCLWTGWNNGKGHGIIRDAGRRVYLHRFSLAQHYGCEVSALDVVDHLCRNRPCFNPYHLEDTNYLENWRRGEGATKHAFKKPEEYQAQASDGLSQDDIAALTGDWKAGYK